MSRFLASCCKFTRRSIFLNICRYTNFDEKGRAEENIFYMKRQLEELKRLKEKVESEMKATIEAKQAQIDKIEKAEKAKDKKPKQ